MHTQLLKSKTGITKIIFFRDVCVFMRDRQTDRQTLGRNPGPVIYSYGTPAEFSLHQHRNLRKWVQIIYRRVATTSLKTSDTN